MNEQNQTVEQAPAEVATTQTTAPAPIAKAAPAIPDVLVKAGLADCFTQPRKAFMAAGGTPEQFAREVNFAMSALLNNSYLVDCAKKAPEHLVEAIKATALTGLTLNPELRLGYLVPYKGKIKFQSSYMGKIDILIRTGLVRDIYAELVYSNDKFIYRKGANATLEHYPDPFNPDRGEIIGGYYYATLTNGMVKYDVMPVARINEIKARSESVKSGKQSPWDTDYAEMARKTIISWAYKFLPKTGISEDALRVLEAANKYDNEEFADYVELTKKNEAQKHSFANDGEYTTAQVVE